MIERFKANAAMNNPAVGCSQLTPTQLFFIETNARGRWGNEPTPMIHTAYQVSMNGEGTVDLIRLHAGIGGWHHLGGQGAVDAQAGRC